MSRCLSCNRVLSSREMSRKYVNHAEIKNYADKYICMCTRCTEAADIHYIDIESLPDNDAPDEFDNVPDSGDEEFM